ncbi:TPA: hypothetical protein ACHSLT_003245 [Klebsiella pneumoniae]
MSEFSRETLLNIIETDHVQCGEASALARIALAALDSEPVATLDVQSGRPDGNKFALVFSSAAHKLPDEVYFLYRHAQPEPIVPKSISVRQAISALESAGAVTTIGQAYKMGWNACRAAMLSGGKS